MEPRPPLPPEIAARLAALGDRFALRLRNDLARLDALRGDAPGHLPELAALAHGLAGAAGSFGFPEVGAAASAFEEAVERLREGDDDPAVLPPRAEALASAIRAALPPGSG